MLQVRYSSLRMRSPLRLAAWRQPILPGSKHGPGGIDHHHQSMESTGTSRSSKSQVSACGALAAKGQGCALAPARLGAGKRNLAAVSPRPPASFQLQRILYRAGQSAGRRRWQHGRPGRRCRCPVLPAAEHMGYTAGQAMRQSVFRFRPRMPGNAASYSAKRSTFCVKALAVAVTLALNAVVKNMGGKYFRQNSSIPGRTLWPAPPAGETPPDIRADGGHQLFSPVGALGRHLR